MAECDVTASGDRGKSDFLKRVAGGRTLCSEVNKAASNAKFLHMRRHHAFVSQLESAKHNMLVENGRAQRDMRRLLDVYRKRKRNIFMDKVMSHQSRDDEDDVMSQAPSATSQSSRGGGRKSSCYSINRVPPPGSSGSSGIFPAILRVPMVTSDDDNIKSAIQRQFQQHMRRQESLHAQILGSRVHEFCGEVSEMSSSSQSFYITNPRRRIAFSEGTKSAKGRRLGSALPDTAKATLASVA